MTPKSLLISAPAGRIVIHAMGDWPAAAVQIQIVPSSWKAPSSVVQQIDAEWDRVARTGITLFDGPMCRLERFHASPAALTLALSETTYRIFVGTHLYHADLADVYGPSILANSIGVSVLVRTADGWLLLGRRNESVVYYAGRLHPFAGALEPSDESNPFVAARRELHEEAGLVESDITALRCVALVEDHQLRQSELIMRADTRLSRTQVETQLGREEHHDLVAIEAADQPLRAALHTPTLTPVALGGLLVWARSEWGDPWLQTAMAELK
jgi:8-oxo-dGTP pyrophosphatase MutT (NUDIX family)